MRFKSSTIKPAEFKYLDSYDLGGAEDPPYNVPVCNTIMITLPTVENYIALGSCDVCGTWFRYGEIWLHEPTGLVMTIGHICAHNYGLIADDSDYDHLRAVEARKQRRRIERRGVRRNIRVFLEKHPGMIGILRGHSILNSLRAKLIHWGDLTSGQIILAEKIDKEVLRTREVIIDEVPKCRVIEGRFPVEGELIGLSGAGEERVTQMLVQIPHPDGKRFYRVYGTAPQVIQDYAGKLQRDHPENLDDTMVRHRIMIGFTARFEQRRGDPTFGFFKHPTKARIIKC